MFCLLWIWGDLWSPNPRLQCKSSLLWEKKEKHCFTDCLNCLKICWFLWDLFVKVLGLLVLNGLPPNLHPPFQGKQIWKTRVELILMITITEKSKNCIQMIIFVWPAYTYIHIYICIYIYIHIYIYTYERINPCR